MFQPVQAAFHLIAGNPWTLTRPRLDLRVPSDVRPSEGLELKLKTAMIVSVGICSDCRQRGRSRQLEWGPLSRALATVLRPSFRNYAPSHYPQHECGFEYPAS